MLTSPKTARKPMMRLALARLDSLAYTGSSWAITDRTMPSMAPRSLGSMGFPATSQPRESGTERKAYGFAPVPTRERASHCTRGRPAEATKGTQATAQE